jgi:RNase P subunit RPR2
VHISKWPKADTQWYLGVRCQKCQSPILFAVDQSEGNKENAVIAKLVLTCSQANCGHRADYSKARVSRFQKTPPTQKAQERETSGG